VDIGIEFIGVRVVLVGFGIVNPPLHLGYHAIYDRVFIGGLLDHTRDNERGAGLIYEDPAHLIHDGIVVISLDNVVSMERHIGAEIVEAILVVGPVGDIAGVGFGAGAAPGVLIAVVFVVVVGIVDIGAALIAGLRRLSLNDADAHPQQMVDGTVPDRVAFGEV